MLEEASLFVRLAVAQYIVANAQRFVVYFPVLDGSDFIRAEDFAAHVTTHRSVYGSYWEALEWQAAIELFAKLLPPLVFISGNTDLGLLLHNSFSSSYAEGLITKCSPSGTVSAEAITALPAEVRIVVCTVRERGVADEPDHFEEGVRCLPAAEQPCGGGAAGGITGAASCGTAAAPSASGAGASAKSSSASSSGSGAGSTTSASRPQMAGVKRVHPYPSDDAFTAGVHETEDAMLERYIADVQAQLAQEAGSSPAPRRVGMGAAASAAPAVGAGGSR